jgi:hypothetical protein
LLASSPFHTLLVDLIAGPIITASMPNLNAIEFISHGAEWIAKRPQYQTVGSPAQ